MSTRWDVYFKLRIFLQLRRWSTYPLATTHCLYNASKLKLITLEVFQSQVLNLILLSPVKAICIKIEDLVNSEVVQHVCKCSVRSLISRNVGNKIYRLHKHLYHTSVLDIVLSIPRELYSRVRYWFRSAGNSEVTRSKTFSMPWLLALLCTNNSDIVLAIYLC